MEQEQERASHHVCRDTTQCSATIKHHDTPVTSTSPWRSSARCACSTARRGFRRRGGVEPHPRRCAAGHRTAYRDLLVTRWTGRRGFHRCVEMIIDGSARPAGRPVRGRRVDFRGVSTWSGCARCCGRPEARRQVRRRRDPDDHAEAAREYRDRLLETSENDDEMMSCT